MVLVCFVFSYGSTIFCFFDLLCLLLFVVGFEPFPTKKICAPKKQRLFRRGGRKMRLIGYIAILCCWLLFFVGILWFFSEVIGPPMTGDQFIRICRNTGGIPKGEVCVCGETVFGATKVPNDWGGC